MKKILLVITLITFLFGCNKEETPVTSISLDVNDLQLTIGETYQLKVSHNPPEAKAPTYEWSSSLGSLIIGGNKYEVVSVDSKGLVTALREGDAIINVETKDILDPTTGQPFKQSCRIRVKPVAATALTLDKSELTLEYNETSTLTCTISPDNTTNKSVYWRSSNPSIVTVTVSSNSPTSLKGELKAMGAGEATITAMISNNSSIFATCNVKVNPTKVESFTLVEKEKTVKQWESFKLTPVFTPTYATNKNITWNSSNENIATVDKNGNITVINVGECDIEAVSEDGDFKAKCKIIVKPIPVESISFANSFYQMEIGGTKQLSVIIIPQNAGNRKINWDSSNPAIASVDENGIIQSYAAGYTTITATSEDGGHTASCNISVVLIDRMVSIDFPSSSGVNINGFYTGNITCAIRNNSSQSIKLTSFSVIETLNFRMIAYTSDESLLGTLGPGEAIALSGRYNGVYEPFFKWEFEYNGETFIVSKNFGSDTFSAKVKSSEKASVQVPLRRTNIK